MPLTPEAQAVANRGWRIIGDEDPEFLANLLAGHLSRSAAPLRGAALTYANELRGKIERAEKLTRERRLREPVAGGHAVGHGLRRASSPCLGSRAVVGVSDRRCGNNGLLRLAA